MRRVSSYGGPSGVAGSERLRQRLSLTPGLHLLSSSPLVETGFLAQVKDPQDERVFHRTYEAARNFNAIASNLKRVVRGEPRLARKDPVGPVRKETIAFDESVDVAEHSKGGAPAVLAKDVGGNRCRSPKEKDSETREVGVEAVQNVSFYDTQVVELENCVGTSAPEDHLFVRSDSQGCGSGLLESRVEARELKAEGVDLETEQPSIVRLEVEDSLSTSPICAGQDAQTSRRGKYESATADREDFLGNERSQEVETGAGPQDSDNDRCKDNSAAIDIQRHWRGWQERKHFREVKGRVVFLQSLVRRNQELKQYHGLMQAATVIQKYWRVFQSVQALEHLKSEQALREQRKVYNAAIMVQKYWRSVRSRRLLYNLKKERDVTVQQRNNLAAVVLQKHWRAQRGRSLVKVLRMEQVAREQLRIEDAAVVLQKHWRARRGRFLVEYMKLEQVVNEKQRIDNAAVVLQKHWRAFQGRCLVRERKTDKVVKEQQRIHEATLVAQKCWRAKQGRRSVELLKLEVAAREQLRIHHAAIVLQKYWRAKKGRLAFRCLKSEQVAREQLRKDNAAIVLQKHLRAIQGRRVLKHLKMEKVAKELERVNDAAVVVQKHWRAKRGRSNVKNLKLEQLGREQQRIDHAAIVIQKHWRSKQGKCSVKRLREEQVAMETQKIIHAALVIQKYYRRQHVRCLVNRMRTEQAVKEKQRIDQATVVLQKHWRGRSGRVLVEHKRMELGVKELQRMDHAAIFIQKLWRGRKSRGLVEHMRLEQLVKQRKMEDATTVLQKYWRGRQSRCVVTDLRKKQLEENAVIVVQKMDLALRESHRATAATTVQKQWRAWQSILLVKRLKMKAAVMERQRLDNAATVFQKCWRGRHSRLLLKHLKAEQELKLERMNNAALAIQKSWRRFQSKQVCKFLYLQQAVRERAALCIQARVRGNATRSKLKAALSMQKAWQLYWCSRVTVSAVSIQHALTASSDAKRKIEVIIFLQAYVHGLVERRKSAQVPKPADISLQPRPICKTFSNTGMAVATSPRMVLGGSDLYSRCTSEAEDILDSSPSSSVVHNVDAEIKSVDQPQSSLVRSVEHDPYVSQSLDGEFSATSVGHRLSQKNGVQEDWNYVAVDQLEECLDTCLAALRPLPSGSQHCLPGLDVPENPGECITADQNAENEKDLDNLSINTCELAKQVPRSRSDIGEPDKKLSNLIESASNNSKTQWDPVTSQATPIGGTDHLDISDGPSQEAGSKQMENNVQRRNLGRQTLKQEQRLKQFAQVFLLQRHIALQQQRAQAAPPFPPPMSSGSEIPSQMVHQPVEAESKEQVEVAVNSNNVHTTAKLSQVEMGRLTEDHIICEITDPIDQRTARGNSQADQASGAKPAVERPGSDVVLDMVLLLRRIEAEYGTSEVDFEGKSSTWCTPGCGDIEEGIPLLERNFGSMRRESSVAKFAHAVSMKHISIPDVNAVLLVFIAMVVYTRTVCKSLLFGARETHRRP